MGLIVCAIFVIVFALLYAVGVYMRPGIICIASLLVGTVGFVLHGQFPHDTIKLLTVCVTIVLMLTPWVGYLLHSKRGERILKTLSRKPEE